MSDERTVTISVQPDEASAAINESAWANAIPMTPEQNETITLLIAGGFDIVVHPDGAVELRT